MVGKYPYQTLLKYPHLRPEEALIWERFIWKYPDRFESVDYDVKVGTPREYPDVGIPKLKEAMEELSLKRIDVVGYSLDKAFIIEIEPNAMLPGLGEVVAKTKLFKEKYPNFKSYYPMLITDRENPDMRRLAGDFGVIFEVV